MKICSEIAILQVGFNWKSIVNAANLALWIFFPSVEQQLEVAHDINECSLRLGWSNKK